MGFEPKKIKKPIGLYMYLLRVIHFITGCPINNCGLHVEYKYQSVKVRFFNVYCKCGKQYLYFENDEMN